MKISNYKIARDLGRAIGYDLLIANYGGMHFSHPSFINENEKIFEGTLASCKELINVLDRCFIIDGDGNRVIIKE